MISNKYDFGLCMFNPVIEEAMVTAYPVLKEILSKEWEEDGMMDEVIRYVVIVYDPRSPLVLNEKDLRIRKQEAAEIVGITGDTTMEAIFTCAYPGITNLITGMLQRFIKSKEWAAICAFEYTFWESIKELMKPISGKSSKEMLESVQKKAVIKEQVELDISRLDALYSKFFGQDQELVKKRRITPEMIANR